MERLKILITGGTGFIGSNLARFFYLKGNDVAITLRNESNTWRISDILKNVTQLKADLTDTPKVLNIFDSFKPDIVIHVAGWGTQLFEVDERRIFNANLLSTINVVEAFLKSKSELLINSGSATEYGIKTNPMSESDILEPIGSYAISKAAATLYSRSRSVENNRKIATFRIFIGFGYYEEPHHLIPYLLHCTLKGITATLNNSNNVRDFIFIDDICSAYDELIKKSNDIGLGEIFNLGSGKEYTVEQVLNTVERISDKKLNVKWQYRNDRLYDKANHWVANTSKTEEILKWKPKYTLEEGLRTTYDWISENVSKYNLKNG